MNPSQLVSENKYDPQSIEAKWQQYWEAHRLYQTTDDPKRPKYYCLVMFPYPSGRIHTGHVRNYVIGDVIARYKVMRGYNVLHPIGWDAFGLPAENAAIERGIHPARWTQDNIEYMRGQLLRLGISYDWGREINTSQPEYYRWNQWFFIKMYERGLAYKKRSAVNWCPSCETVLANEQVLDEACWRCDSTVTQKDLEQWFFKITAYAEELLQGCDRLTGWPERVLAMQRNWIGESIGAEADFPLAETEGAIRIFTTRQDTLFGATFMSLAPEHPMVEKLISGKQQAVEVRAFVERIKRQDKKVRTAEGLEKEGVFTGAYAINPMTRERIPIWVANFVLMEYGTGAIMAVPAHDQRDFEFAKKYGIPIHVVIQNPEGTLSDETISQAYTDEPGQLIRSGSFSGLSPAEAKEKIANYLETQGLGKRTVNYRIRDWGISRQRYWGTPIPIIYCDRCGMLPVPYKDLPVKLPQDVPLTGKGKSPLLENKAFLTVPCPRCGNTARRETDTMDTFMDSSWYFLRYLSPHLDSGPFDQKAGDHWMPVDQYIGGIEHAVLHLLYARFFTKVVRDLGLLKGSHQALPGAAAGSGGIGASAEGGAHGPPDGIDGIDEPFSNLLTQGMVVKESHRCPEHGYLFLEEITSDGRCPHCHRPAEVGRTEKMSKSKKNVVEPDNLMVKYGADTLRLFCLFAAPPEKDLEWSDQGVEGAYRFLNRVWRLVIQVGGDLLKKSDFGSRISDFEIRNSQFAIRNLSKPDLKLRRATHRTIKKVTEDLEGSHQALPGAAASQASGSAGDWPGGGGIGSEASRPPHHNAPGGIGASAEGGAHGPPDSNRNFQFNTAIAALMEFYNTLSQSLTRREISQTVAAEALDTLVVLLCPFAPHIAEQLWECLGHRPSITHQPWPSYDPALLITEEITVAIQVNGKLRGQMTVPTDLPEEEVKARAVTDDRIRKWTEDRPPKKVIYVKGRLVNIVL